MLHLQLHLGKPQPARVENQNWQKDQAGEGWAKAQKQQYNESKMKVHAACCPSPPPKSPFTISPPQCCLLFLPIYLTPTLHGCKPAHSPSRQTGDALTPPHHLPALFSQAGSQARLGAQPVATAYYRQGSCWGLIQRWKDPGSPEVSEQLCSSRSP